MVTHPKINNSIVENSEKNIDKKVEQITIKEEQSNKQSEDLSDEQTEDLSNEQSEDLDNEQTEDLDNEQTEDLHNEVLEEQSNKQPERKSSNNNPSSESTTDNESLSPEKICRICYDDQKEEKLISPCKCSGSVKWVHHSCLQKWIDISHKKECSTCKYTYQYQKKYKRHFYKHLDHTYVPKILTIFFILITTILSGLISKLLMKLLKFNNKIKIGFNLKYLFFSLKYFSLLFFVSLPILHYLKIVNIREIYTNYISLYERNNTVYGQGVGDISIFIYLTIYKFFEKNINKLTESEKVIMEYVPEKNK